MKTRLSGNTSSIAIRNHFGPNMELEILGTSIVGGERLTLYRARTGQEVIETNGEPIWDSEADFEVVRGQIVNE